MVKAETKRIKLIVISIGTEERARDFCRENEFPMEILYADPINVTYDKLRLNFGVKENVVRCVDAVFHRGEDSRGED